MRVKWMSRFVQRIRSGRTQVIAAVGIVALALGAMGCPAKTQVKRKAAGGVTPLYEMSLPQIDSVDFPFAALRGKVVIVDFFASYCMPCLHIMPRLQKLYARHRKKGFLVVGIALERQVKQILVPFLNYLKVEYPILVADEAIYRGATVFGRVRQIPRSVLIDRCGKIRRVFVGVPDVAAMEGILKKYINENANTCP